MQSRKPEESRLAAAAPGSQKCFLQSQKQGQSPALGLWPAWASWQCPGADPDTAKPCAAPGNPQSKQLVLLCAQPAHSCCSGLSPAACTWERVPASPHLLGPARLPPFPQNCTGVNTENHFMPGTPGAHLENSQLAASPYPAAFWAQRGQSRGDHEVTTR